MGAADYALTVASTFIGDSGEPTLWEQIECKVKDTVRKAIFEYHKIDIFGILDHCHNHLERLNLRALAITKNIENPEAYDTSRTGLIDDIYDHYNQYVLGNDHLFSLSTIKKLSIFDVSLFRLHLSFTTHKLILVKLQMTQLSLIHI